MAPRREPKYVTVKNALLRRFDEQRYQDGQKLPTEFELMEELSVSRTTVRQAIGGLEEDGVVERRHGSGTYYKAPASGTTDAGGLIGLINFYFNDYIYP
ncbi:MAG: GntR family transcriptional regulator, partial [Desulfobacterales bacterium]|nr:GntR family transcriptional regulator [Desulfobacterales bacterium]